MPGEAPPAMIEIDAVGAIAILCEKRSMMLYSAASRQGPRSSASLRDAASDWSFTCRSEEHTSELQSLMRISYAVFCLKNKNSTYTPPITSTDHTTVTHPVLQQVTYSPST